MRIRRPLIWILGGWILGEIVAAGLGWNPSSVTGLDLVMEEQEVLPVTVAGKVSRITESASGIQVILTENQLLRDGMQEKTHDLLLRESTDNVSPSFSSLCPGMWIQAEGELRAFPDASNPGEFDRRAYYRSMGIDYQMDTDEWFCLREANALQKSSWQLKQMLKESIRRVTHREENAGIFQAMLLGERSLLDEETKNLYEAGGIMHILSISALHLTLLGGTLRKLLDHLHVPRIFGGILCVLFLGWYVWLTGGSASSRRAFLMFFVLTLAPAAGRTYDALSALGFAGLLLLTGQPSLIFQTGFQLSFAAVAGIGILYPLTAKIPEQAEEKKRPGRRLYLKKWKEKTAGALRVSLCIQIATLPVLAWHYHVIAPYGLLLNLVVIPMMTPVMISALLSAVVGLFSLKAGRILAAGGEMILKMYREGCLLVSSLPGSRIVTGQPHLRQIFLYLLFLLAMILFLTDRKKKQKKEQRVRWNEKKLQEYQSMKREEKKTQEYQNRKPSGEKFRKLPMTVRLILVFAMGILLLHRIPEQQLAITVLDVGQGDSAWIHLPEGENILCDGGSTSVSGVGSGRILPYLEYEGISRVDLVFLSHEDEDHINGIEEMIREEGWHPGMIAASAACEDAPRMRALYQMAEEKKIPFLFMETGDQILCGKAKFTCLYPDRNTEADSNDRSLVLRMEYGSFSGLLTGDASVTAEEQFLPVLPVVWLKTGHHGSASSTSEELLQCLKPEIATISCGKKNRYGHPHPDTLSRLANAKVPVYTTAECGAVFLRWEEKTLSVSCSRHGKNHQEEKVFSAIK